MDLARRQQRIVGEDGSRSHGDRVDLGAHRVRMPKRIVRADARALPDLRRHAVVEARRRLHDDERPMLRLEREIRAVQPERTLAAGADRHVDALLTQKIEPATAHARIGVDRGRNDARDAGCRDAFDARSGSADVRARLERAVERRAAREIARLVERTHLGVRSACVLVISLTDDRAVFAHDDRADHRIRTGRSAAALGEIERAVHVLEIRQHALVLRSDPLHHFVSNNASTYSFTLNGMRSSIVSPTPT